MIAPGPTSSPSTVRQLGWSIRRELWENRSVYVAPLAVAALFLIGYSIALFRLPETMRAVSALDPLRRQETIEQPYVVAAMMLMAIALLVSVFYSLDALYGERRDRSVLFWKSFPVSDGMTVIAKASIPILVLPFVTFAVTMATQLLMLLASSAVLAVRGQGSGTLWSEMSLLEAGRIHLLHLVGFHGLMWAPLYGWLLLMSAWAKRTPVLWAALPPLAIGAVERIALGTSHFAGFLQNYFLGGPMTESTGGMTMDILAQGPVEGVLLRPGLWVGLLVTAAFLLAAARLRRSRGPI